MKVHDMEMLVRVAETGSMTLAGRQLNMTPAAVSAAVRRVEEEIGIRLFERTTRSIHPTSEGLAVLEGCQDVVERWRQTLETVQGDHHELTGTVHLSAPADTSYEVVAPVVVAVAEEHPRLQVVVHASDAIQHLHRDAIDVAIRYGPLQDSTLSARRLADGPGILVAAPSYLVGRPSLNRPQDLMAHRCISLQLSGVPVMTWALQGPDATHEIHLRSPLCGDGYLSRRWAIAGMGIAMKSLFDVVDDLETGRLVRVLPDYTTGQVAIHAVFPSRRHQPARVRILDAALSKEFSARSARCARWEKNEAGA